MAWGIFSQHFRGEFTQQLQACATTAVIDSQSTKTTKSGGPRGYDAGKKGMGRKRPPWWTLTAARWSCTHPGSATAPHRGCAQRGADGSSLNWASPMLAMLATASPGPVSSASRSCASRRGRLASPYTNAGGWWSNSSRGSVATAVSSRTSRLLSRQQRPSSTPASAVAYKTPGRFRTDSHPPTWERSAPAACRRSAARWRQRQCAPTRPR